MSVPPPTKPQSTAIEIAQHLHDGTDVDRRIALRLGDEWLTQMLVDKIVDDEWGDTNAESALEDVVVSASELLSGAFVEVAPAGDEEEMQHVVDAFLDEVMASADSIVANAQDRLAEEDPRASRMRAGLNDDL